MNPKLATCGVGGGKLEWASIGHGKRGREASTKMNVVKEEGHYASRWTLFLMPKNAQTFG